MSVACAAEVCGRFLWEGDTSNKPLSGQATTNPQLRHLKLPACHSRAAFEGPSEIRTKESLNTSPRAFKRLNMPTKLFEEQICAIYIYYSRVSGF